MARLRSIMLLVVTGIATTGGLAISQSTPSSVPPNGFAPDSATAARIAEAVWIPVYGAEQIAKEKPFKATLQGAVDGDRGLVARHGGRCGRGEGLEA